MAIGADFSVERATGNIRHISGSENYDNKGFDDKISAEDIKKMVKNTLK